MLLIFLCFEEYQNIKVLNMVYTHIYMDISYKVKGKVGTHGSPQEGEIEDLGDGIGAGGDENIRYQVRGWMEGESTRRDDWKGRTFWNQVET